jgi:hypothetical protein
MVYNINNKINKTRGRDYIKLDTYPALFIIIKIKKSLGIKNPGQF